MNLLCPGIAYYKISAKEGEETTCILQWFCDQAHDTHGLAILKDGNILAHSVKH